MTQDLTSHQGAGNIPGAGNGATAARGGVRAAVEAAERAFASWPGTPPAQRRGLLQRASELLMRRQSEIAALVTEETGGTLGWGGFDVQLAAGMLAYYAGQAGAAAEEEREIPSQIPGKRAKAVRQPAGVVMGIVPWSAPVILGVRAVAAPLAYGNTMVLKASEQCPRTHAAIVDALKDAGVPAGAINLVTSEPGDAAEVVEELVAHPAVRRISFTGSTRARAHYRPDGGAAPQAGCCSSWAARLRWWCWPTLMWSVPWRRPASARSCTRGRSACRPSATAE